MFVDDVSNSRSCYSQNRVPVLALQLFSALGLFMVFVFLFVHGVFSSSQYYEGCCRSGEGGEEGVGQVLPEVKCFWLGF